MWYDQSGLMSNTKSDSSPQILLAACNQEWNNDRLDLGNNISWLRRNSIREAVHDTLEVIGAGSYLGPGISSGQETNSMERESMEQVRMWGRISTCQRQSISHRTVLFAFA